MRVGSLLALVLLAASASADMGPWPQTHFQVRWKIPDRPKMRGWLREECADAACAKTVVQEGWHSELRNKPQDCGEDCYLLSLKRGAFQRLTILFADKTRVSPVFQDEDSFSVWNVEVHPDDLRVVKVDGVTLRGMHIWNKELITEIAVRGALGYGHPLDAVYWTRWAAEAVADHYDEIGRLSALISVASASCLQLLAAWLLFARRAPRARARFVAVVLGANLAAVPLLWWYVSSAPAVMFAETVFIGAAGAVALETLALRLLAPAEFGWAGALGAALLLNAVSFGAGWAARDRVPEELPRRILERRWDREFEERERAQKARWDAEEAAYRHPEQRR